MHKLLMFCLLTAGAVYVFDYWLEAKQADAYQQAAVRCAMNPEAFNCKEFTTASGDSEQ
jgi:hypothetical protein